MNQKIILRGNNVQRYFAGFLGLFFIFIALININDLKILSIIPILFGLIIFLLIQFPRFEISDKDFTYRKIGLIKGFNLKQIYKFDDIKNVRFEKGDGISSLMYKLFLNKRSRFGEQTDSDRMIIEFKNDKIKIFNRINSKENFKNLIDKMNRMIKK
ncbi:hypothetical protein R3X25_15005 [Lutibacter sp. TH_r2]|uniref:hypothetical protein n=1 Tax=Lutibacter sp. TH_r2 TaxID=3082083 RepID=UPI002954D065|nr:hypothetical protein [Lutibacter sp. TH_r2]MDV7188594.1 hypothetical protein [Lutibacter sp. TH_r2]